MKFSNKANMNMQQIQLVVMYGDGLLLLYS